MSGEAMGHADAGREDRAVVAAVKGALLSIPAPGNAGRSARVRGGAGQGEAHPTAAKSRNDRPSRLLRHAVDALTTRQFGDACEYLVLAELMLADWPAHKMPDGWPGY